LAGGLRIKKCNGCRDRHRSFRAGNQHHLATGRSLTIGIVISYVLLFAAVLLAAGFTIDAGLLGDTLQHPATDPGLRRGCLDDSIGGLVGGAPSGFESKDDILRAAYGQRERYRRQSSADDD
jgi:hypothetical protein